MGDERPCRAESAGLQLGALPDDLHERLQAAEQSTGGPPHLLLEAVMSVGRGLELPHVLRRIVEAAVVLVDAEYGALGVIGDGSRLSQFLTVGICDEEAEAIGPLPAGHGILGELIRRPAPLRLMELGEHPSSYGLPPHHPPMHSFLGVPIRVRDEVFGNLYLTEKRGGGEFARRSAQRLEQPGQTGSEPRRCDDRRDAGGRRDLPGVARTAAPGVTHTRTVSLSRRAGRPPRQMPEPPGWRGRPPGYAAPHRVWPADARCDS